MENIIIYTSPASGNTAANKGMPTNPVFPKMKHNWKTRSLSCSIRIAFAVRNMSKLMVA